MLCLSGFLISTVTNNFVYHLVCPELATYLSGTKKFRTKLGGTYAEIFEFEIILGSVFVGWASIGHILARRGPSTQF